MDRQPISFERLVARPIGLFHNHWFLLSAGNFATREFNCMTISWGSIGQVWGKPMVQVFVRPSRYTNEFIEKYATFTLCTFPMEYHPELNHLGSRSGRDGNKLAEVSITPMAALKAEAPVYEEAELAIECRKMYWQDIDPTHFLLPSIEQSYPLKDYHRIYFGEVLVITGSEDYTA